MTTRPISTSPFLRPLHRLAQTVLLASSLALSACGGGWLWEDDPVAAASVTLSGVAATGAAIANGDVKVVNAKGETVITRTSSSGDYSVTIGDAPPYALSVVDGAGKVWYSYAAAAGTANITPLTTLALLDANGNKPLVDLLANWTGANLSASQVLESAKKVNANLSALMTASGVNPASTNIFNSAFSANHSGLDAVLDAMRVSFNCSATACTQTIASPAGNALVSWSGNIATTGISLSWSVGEGATAGTGGTAAAATSGTINVSLSSCKNSSPGTYSMIVQTTVSGLGVAIPEICVEGLPDKPATQADFCSGTTTRETLPVGVAITSCTYDGTTATIDAVISSPIAISYSIKYTFVKR